MKFLFVYKENTSSKIFANSIYNTFYDVDIIEISNFPNININKYHKIIFAFRKMSDNLKLLNYKVINNDKFIFMTSDYLTSYPFKTAANGFNEYITGKQDYFMPICSNESGSLRPKNDTIGFYSNKQIHTYNDRALYDEFQKQHPNMRFIELGKYSKNIIKFMNNISHFLYIHTKNFDAFPNTLIEAILSNKQIIIPEPINEKLPDGSFDIKEAIEYHTNYDCVKLYDNSNTIISKYSFLKVWTLLYEHNFEYSFNKNKYKTYVEWYNDEIK